MAYPLCATDFTSKPWPMVLDPASSYDPSLVGRIIGDDIRVIARAGSAPEGPLYHAEYPDGRPLAVLVLQPLSTGRQVSRARWFRLATEIQHPNVAAVYGVGELEEGSTYVALEQLEGEPLEQLLQGGALPLDEAVDLAVQAAAGLEAAHRAGFVHGNLSPSTILVTRAPYGQSHVKLVGFNPDPDRRLATRPDASSRAYASPERLSGTPPPDERCDVFSLAAVLHHLLTGVPPVSGHGLAAVPEPAREALHKALAPFPAARFQSMTEFRKALERLPLAGGSPGQPVVRRVRRTAILVGGLTLLAGGLSLLPVWRPDTTRDRAVTLPATGTPKSPGAESSTAGTAATPGRPRASEPTPKPQARGPRGGSPTSGTADPGDAVSAPDAEREDGTGPTDDATLAGEALGYVAETPAVPESATVEQRRAATARPRSRPVTPPFPAVDRRSLSVLEQDQGMRYAIGDLTRIGLAEGVVEVRRGFLVVFLAPGGMSVPSAIYNLQRLYLAYLAASPQQDSVSLELREEGELYGWFTRSGLRYAEADQTR